MNIWYNLVNRAWKADGRLYVGTFINDLSTGKWFHTATLSIPDPGIYLGCYNDAFLENWDGQYPSMDGRFTRKAFFKDCWNLNTNGIWEKSSGVSCDVNDTDKDKQRNGIYHNSFNAFYDNTENAYCMEHGGSTTPSPGFKEGRSLNLPFQADQGVAPVLTIAKIKSIAVNNATGIRNISWNIDELKPLQLSAKIEILNAAGNIITELQDTLPQRRSIDINDFLESGSYAVRITVIDIFNQQSQPMTTTFNV
jgi:hypothetical protein